MQAIFSPSFRGRLLITTALIVALIAAFFSINKELNFDEAEFAAASQGLLREGKPIYQMGEPLGFEMALAPWVFANGPRVGYQLGLWHSSYYLPLIAAAYRVFGMSDWSTRIVGFLCWGLALLLILGFTPKVERLPLAFLYLITPVFLQQSLMIDFDNTVGIVAILASLLLYQKLEKRRQLFLYFAVQVLAIALQCWSKEYLPIYWIPAVLCFEILRRDWKRVLVFCLASLAGITIFWMSWKLWTHSMGVDPSYFINFSFVRRAQSPSGLGDVSSLLKSGGFQHWFSMIYMSICQTSIYLDLSFLVLLGMGFGYFRKILKKPNFDTLVLLVVIALFLITKIARPSIISYKYEYPMLPLLLWLMVRSHGSHFEARTLGLLCLFSLPVAIVRMVLIGDPNLKPVSYGFSSVTLSSSILESLVFLTLIYLLGLKLRNRKLIALPERSVIFTSAAVGLVAFNLATTALQTRDYLTTVNITAKYGSRGIKEIAKDLAELYDKNPDSKLFLPKDVALRALQMRGTVDRFWTHPIELNDPEIVRKLAASSNVLIVGEPEGAKFVLYLAEQTGMKLLAERGDYILVGKVQNR
jgi:hypothetical protein